MSNALPFHGRRSLLLASLALALAPVCASAQSFPSKPVRLIVPFSAGASPDVMARVVGEDLARRLGQPVIVENRPGAGGNIAASYVVNEVADGHTVFVGSTANLAVNKTLYKQLPYDPEKDFQPLTVAWMTWNVLIVSADAPYRSVADVVEAAAAQPGKLSYGSPGHGTAGHLIGALFESETDTRLTHVPYKGQNQVVNDLLGGHIALSFETIGSALPTISAGKVRALAITSRERHPKLPDVPTFAESGVPAVDDLRGWAMFAVAKDTPEDAVAVLHSALSESLTSAPVRNRIEDLGVEIRVTTPDESRQMIQDEVQRWGRLVKATGAQID